MDERDIYDDDYDEDFEEEEYYDQDNEEDEPYDYGDECPIQKLSYKIVPTFDLSKQPTIHGMIRDCRLRIVFKDGRILNVGCVWEDYPRLREEEHKKMSKQVVEEINKIIQERLPEELYEHIWTLPREFVGEFNLHKE